MSEFERKTDKRRETIFGLFSVAYPVLLFKWVLTGLTTSVGLGAKLPQSPANVIYITEAISR